jgi:hypothetical protein
MPSAASFKMLGNWDKQIGVPLEDALAVSMDVFGYTGEKACRQCIYFMTQSAQTLTKLGQRKRPVHSNPDFKHLMRKEQYKKWRMAGHDLRYYFKNTAWYLQQDSHPMAKLGGLQRWGNHPEKLAKIGNVGLAKRSWMWGFGKGRPIPGVTELWTVSGRVNTRGENMSGGDTDTRNITTNGYILTNRLDYVMDALPQGWEEDVERSATNRIMGRFRDKMENQWRQEMHMPRKERKAPSADAAFLAKYFTT